jgi:small subunit ribosomal protein S15
MSINKEVKKRLIAENKLSDKDNGGSVEVQVVVLTERIKNLTEHIKVNRKDNHGRRGLLLMVNRRRKLLRYIKNRNSEEYDALIAKLGIRK